MNETKKEIIVFVLLILLERWDRCAHRAVRPRGRAARVPPRAPPRQRQPSTRIETEVRLWSTALQREKRRKKKEKRERKREMRKKRAGGPGRAAAGTLPLAQALCYHIYTWAPCRAAHPQPSWHRFRWPQSKFQPKVVDDGKKRSEGRKGGVQSGVRAPAGLQQRPGSLGMAGGAGRTAKSDGIGRRFPPP